MSNTKQQLIEKIIELLLREFEPHSVSARDREFLEMATVEYLENKLKELQAEAVANLRKQHVAAALAGLGRLPLPKRWRRWLFDEHSVTSN
jgi:hypothetical protein